MPIHPLQTLPLHAVARAANLTPPLPVSLALSLNDVCNLRCKTCDIWKPRPTDKDQMTAEEWEKTFARMGFRPYWITVTGGEPLLRPDAARIVSAALKTLKPERMTLITNGHETERIDAAVEEILKSAGKTKIALHVSFDGDRALHDEIRGREGSYDRAAETLRRMKRRSGPRFEAGISATISKWNADRFEEWSETLRNELQSDAFVSEIAMGRVEFSKSDEDVRPPAEQINSCLGVLIQMETNGNGGVRSVFRKEYYSKLKNSFFAASESTFACYAARASAHILHDGRIVACSVLGEELGRLRDADYRFQKIWTGKKAQEVRNAIKSRNCQCSQANIAYVNQLFRAKTLAKLARNVISND